jgi:hypothetical protein
MRFVRRYGTALAVSHLHRNCKAWVPELALAALSCILPVRLLCVPSCCRTSHYVAVCVARCLHLRVSVQDKDALRQLLKAQNHPGVTPEIHRELNHGHSRGHANQVAGERRRAMTAVTENFKSMAQVVVDDMEY